MVTVYFEVYVPATGEKVGVAMVRFIDRTSSRNLSHGKAVSVLAVHFLRSLGMLRSATLKGRFPPGIMNAR
jgi:hypothetical protein